MQTPYKAVYVGHLLTPQNIPLRGKTATIHFRYETVHVDDNIKPQYMLHATFDDPDLGRYHSFTHRFREEEFNKHIEYHATEFNEHDQTYNLGWYFRDETGGLYGPYDTADQAQQVYETYCKSTLGAYKV